MPKLTRMWVGCVAMTLLLPAIGSADQLAKKGSYSGKYFWSEHVNVFEIEKDHMYMNGVQQGVFFNNAGSGFLHAAVVACASQGIVKKDQYSFAGYCHLTDKDGDKALLQWACAQGGDRCVGTFDWIGGTGKYAGMRGRSQFDGGEIGSGPLGNIGDSNWKGEWQLQ